MKTILTLMTALIVMTSCSKEELITTQEINNKPQIEVHVEVIKSRGYVTINNTTHLFDDNNQSLKVYLTDYIDYVSIDNHSSGSVRVTVKDYISGKRYPTMSAGAFKFLSVNYN